MIKKMSDLIGNTPMLEAAGYSRTHRLTKPLYLKLEYFNPNHSIKDRIAFQMISQAIKDKKLQSGGTIIEPTSGNTGIGIAAIGASKGFKVILCMPESMSLERRMILKAFGAELVLTDAKKGMNGAIEEARRLQESMPNAILLSQFDNPANPEAHYQTTGPEIYEQMGGMIDILVAGVGTGGTISGAGKYLKEKNPSLRLIAVEPDKSPVLSGGMAGPHRIQGIGAGFVPKNYHAALIDEVVQVTEEQAMEQVRSLAKTEGLFVGISSGAALSAGVEMAKKYPQQRVVVVLPDSGERYLSTELFRAED